MTTLAALQSLIASGESETIELKRSTAELKRTGETLSSFLNGEVAYRRRPRRQARRPGGRRHHAARHCGDARALRAARARRDQPRGRWHDRIEIHSIGAFPTGLRAKLLTQEHRSIPCNSRIAGAFHRTGAIEVWGRGTNRVIEACRAYGIADPTFTEASGAVTVTFRAQVVTGARGLVPGGHQVGTMSALSPYQVQVLEVTDVPRALAELMGPSGRKDRTKFRDQVLAPLLQAGLVEMTIPDKPRSPNQRYRITEAGRQRLRGGS